MFPQLNYPYSNFKRIRIKVKYAVKASNEDGYLFSTLSIYLEEIAGYMGYSTNDEFVNSTKVILKSGAEFIIAMLFDDFERLIEDTDREIELIYRQTIKN